MHKKILSGNQFNKKYSNNEFYKLTTENEKHNGFQFSTGLNIDTVPFNPKDNCRPGGIYFTDIVHIFLWINYDKKIMKHIRKVKIPDDAKVYVEKNKYKADKIILEDPIELDIFLQKNITQEILLIFLKENYNSLYYIPKSIITKDICMEAVKEHGAALQYVPESMKTHDICLVAVIENKNAWQFVPQPIRTTQICKAAGYPKI